MASFPWQAKSRLLIPFITVYYLQLIIVTLVDSKSSIKHICPDGTRCFKQPPKKIGG
ncbi:hypothetical protein SPSYN_01805 [Sporotomaculum syntrophicum]|uniref:Uncharacterized protein n=1 Tax=Sporotomaculum syntrophicum TaxID=182264 RepID=A0A9D3AY44_9FIRM|nr:hypothetical protein SPSYN_01805 [Sporotomaculum syntrophicum]